MFLRRLVIIGYPLAEFLVLWWVASLIGWGFALLLVIAGLPAGAALMRNAAAKATTLQSAEPEQRPTIARSSTMMFLAGVLVMVPGFITDVVGVALLFPPLQRVVARSSGVWVGKRMTRVPGFNASGFSGEQFGFYAQGDVVQGFVVNSEDDDSNPHTSQQEGGKNNGGNPFGLPPQIED